MNTIGYRPPALLRCFTGSGGPVLGAGLNR
jgi:hypothetical protein